MKTYKVYDEETKVFIKTIQATEQEANLMSALQGLYLEEVKNNE